MYRYLFSKTLYIDICLRLLSIFKFKLCASTCRFVPKILHHFPSLIFTPFLFYFWQSTGACALA